MGPNTQDQTVVLLGDSILDNAPYTRPEPDTMAHLAMLLPEWSVLRAARDGARMRDVDSQLRQLGARPAVGVLSIGGNDATAHLGLLERRATSAAEILEELLEIADDFASHYERVVRAVQRRFERTVVCTIYEVQLEPPVLARLAKVPLAVLNDRIVRIAASLGVEVLELRSVCTTPDDFVLQIEPSARGAAKIARAIAALVTGETPLVTGRVFAQPVG